MARMKDKLRQLILLIGAVLVGAGAVAQIAARGIGPWVESDSAVLVAIGLILMGLYDRLNFLLTQFCGVTDIIDSITTNDPDQGPSFSRADARILRQKLGLPH